MTRTPRLLLLLILAVTFTACKPGIKELPDDMEIPENPISVCPDSPNCFRVTQVIEKDSSAVFDAFEDVITDEDPFNIEISKSGQDFSITAVYQIPVFGWLDDVKIIIEPDRDNKNQSFVHLKSSSREGYYDLGVNKRRINRILKKARKELNL